MVQLQIADDVAQGGRAQVFDCGNRAFHTVCIELWIRDLEIHNRINLHRHVVLRDHRLGREIDHLLL